VNVEATKRLKVVWYWQTMGPYHFARMNALAGLSDVELTVVECSRLDDHGWERRERNDFRLVTLSSEQLSSQVLRKTACSFRAILEDVRPDVIVAPGYAQPQCLSPILSYRAAYPTTQIILWSESSAMDAPRLRLKEQFKALMLPVFDGALAAGRAHAEYLRQLRMPAGDIQVVGNCVDNDFFRQQSDAWRRTTAAADRNLPANDFFLYVGRFITVKNLAALLRSYAAYRRETSAAWDLVLVGGGPLEAQLKALVRAESIAGVHFAGVRQIGELPHYYARASCLVLPSLSEPWGLVVNEAMACGLAVAASKRCGCAGDLIHEGVNGFTFDPGDEALMKRTLLRISGAADIGRMGESSREIISSYSPALFAARSAYLFRKLQATREPDSASSRAQRRLRRVMAEKACVLFGASLQLSEIGSFSRPRSAALR
jgi:glycosyltransferase involved in cell wall biosynthesis